MTLTIIVQINPTREHKTLNDGTKTATARAAAIRSSLIIELRKSIQRSLGKHGAMISSNPSANGKAVSVNLENAVKIISLENEKM